MLTFEEMIRDSAISIVSGDENYHRPSLASELANLTAVLRSLLGNEVDSVRKDQENDN